MAEEVLENTDTATQDQESAENFHLSEQPTFTAESVRTMIQEPGLIKLLYLADMIETVTTVPTHVPGKFYDQVKIWTDSLTAPTKWRLYYWSNQTNTWQSSSTSINDLLPSQTGNSGKVLGTNGTTASWVGFPADVPVTGGEALSAGEVVCLKLGTGNFTTSGYQWVNGSVYAVRAAANDTTYGENVLGIMTSSTTYLGTGTCRVVGYISGLTGLTAGVKQYLDNYSGASSTTITQTTSNTNYQLYDPAGTVVLSQLFKPTSSRLDSITIKASKNGGFAGTLRCGIYRANTLLASGDFTLAGGTTPAETTLNLTDIRVYKGEYLTIRLTHDSGVAAQTDAFYIAYQSTGSVFPDGDFTGGTLPASGASLYFKINEYTNFGKVAAAAGTRKFRIGQSLSTTEVAEDIQEDSTFL